MVGSVCLGSVVGASASRACTACCWRSPALLLEGCPGLTTPGLLAQSELLQERPIALEAVDLQVVEEPPALVQEFDEAAARGMVLAVGLEVFREGVDALRQ